MGDWHPSIVRSQSGKIFVAGTTGGVFAGQASQGFWDGFCLRLKTPIEQAASQLQDLIEDVQALGLARIVENILVFALEMALDALANEQTEAATLWISAFVIAADILPEIILPQAEADILIASAEETLSLINP
jgi:hypothetical protein